MFSIFNKILVPPASLSVKTFDFTVPSANFSRSIRLAAP